MPAYNPPRYYFSDYLKIAAVGPGGGPLAGVGRDGTSGLYYPANASQWATVLSVAGVSSLTYVESWNCGVGSGNLTAQNGGAVLTANGAVTYGNAIAGHSKLACGMPDAGAAVRFRSTDAALPDVGTVPLFMLAYHAFTGAPGNIRGVIELGTTQAEVRVTTTPAYRVASTGTTTGLSNCGTALRPVGLAQRSIADTASGYTDQEKIDVAGATGATGKLVGIGATGSASAGPSLFTLAALFSGEPTAADVKALYQTLGFTIPWS